MVGVIASDTARYSMFMVCLAHLEKPVNTMAGWGITSDRILGRNRVVEQALEKGAEWLLFIDDDHTFAPNLLTRLLAHDKPIVGSLYLQRQVPFGPIAYSAKSDDDVYLPLNLTDYTGDELVPVHAVGTGGMLIRSEVLHKMEPPWFEHGRASEDLIFCDKFHTLDMGPIYCDLGARLGHLSPAALWPSFDRERGVWQVGFQFTEGFSMTHEIG